MRVQICFDERATGQARSHSLNIDGGVDRTKKAFHAWYVLHASEAKNVSAEVVDRSGEVVAFYESGRGWNR